MSDPVPHQDSPIAVVAVGGHAFIAEGESGTHEDHARNAAAISAQLLTLVERGYNLVLTHGNGPQVGSLLEQSELAGGQVPRLPLDVLVAQTEGSLGYFLQQALLNELRARSLRRPVVTVITQVEVDEEDPAFDRPQKPVGPVLPPEEAIRRRDELGWHVAEEPGRGWRRVVPSPRPRRVVQAEIIRQAARRGDILVAAGGGGIPVVRSAGDRLRGVEAVIDKDRTSGVLARDVGAELLVILTAIDRVYLDHATASPRPLGAVTMAECERHLQDGHFPPGSMGPKVEAVLDFLQHGGRRGLITDAAHLGRALDGAAGTHFVGKI